MKNIQLISKHQFIFGAFFILFSFSCFAQEDQEIVVSSQIWTDLNVQYDLDSIHHIVFTHQQRYGQQNTDFSTVSLFQFIYRMDNSIMYEYTPKKKWKGGMRESFVLKVNNYRELFTRIFLTHQGHIKSIHFNKSLNVDWFTPLRNNDNPNIVQYDLGRLVYMFDFSKEFYIKEHKIIPLFNIHLFQMQLLQESNFSPYKNVFIDQTRFFLGVDYYPFTHLKVNLFGMLEQRFFAKNDGSTLTIKIPTYGLSIQYFW